MTFPPRLAPLLVGVAVRQALSRTAQVHAALPPRSVDASLQTGPVSTGSFNPAVAALLTSDVR